VIDPKERVGREETRQTILQATERALARHGYRKLTMEDVAEEAGLTRRTVYSYFNGKLELCRAVLEAMRARTYAEMDRELGQPGSGSERLRQVLITRLWGRVQGTLAYHHALAEAVKEVYPKNPEGFRNTAAPDAERIARAIRLGHEDGSLRPCDPDEMAELLVRGSTGFLPSAIGTNDMQFTDAVRRQIETFVDVLVRGLSASPGP
jgi:AcrR family transcriptional regulator